MKTRKLKIAAICCTLSVMGLMLSGCGTTDRASGANMGITIPSFGIADITSRTVGGITQEVTNLAFDAMDYGPRVELGRVTNTDEDLFISLANNAVSIQKHDSDEIRVEYSPPTRERYVIPDMQLNTQANRIEITESSNINDTRHYRSGIVYIYLPQSVDTDRNMIFSSAAGVVRIIGNGDRIAASINISNISGVTELQNFSADEISVTSTAGAISASKLLADNMELRTISGVATLRNSEVFGNLTARTLVGIVTLENVDADMNRADVSLSAGIFR